MDSGDTNKKENNDKYNKVKDEILKKKLHNTDQACKCSIF